MSDNLGAFLPMQELHKQDGRINLCLKLLPVGRDLLVLLAGGNAHVGATALATPDGVTQTNELAMHREGPLASRTARRFAATCDCTASVICGIHFPDISREEISTVERLAEELVNESLDFLNSRSNRPC